MVSKEAHMAGTEGVMERTVREEFEEVVAGRVCVRETEGGVHLIRGLRGHEARMGTLAFTLRETGNCCRILSKGVPLA